MPFPKMGLHKICVKCVTQMILLVTGDINHGNKLDSYIMEIKKTAPGDTSGTVFLLNDIRSYKCNKQIYLLILHILYSRFC